LAVAVRIYGINKYDDDDDELLRIDKYIFHLKIAHMRRNM
jgi:hypothetical protein